MYQYLYIIYRLPAETHFDGKICDFVKTLVVIYERFEKLFFFFVFCAPPYDWLKNCWLTGPM